MIQRGQENGHISPNTHTIIEYSSGSTVISLGIISHILGIPKVKAYVSNKTSKVKLELLRFFVRRLFCNHRQQLLKLYNRASICGFQESSDRAFKLTSD